MAIKTIKFDNGTELGADIIAKAVNVLVAAVEGEYVIINVNHIVNQDEL